MVHINVEYLGHVEPVYKTGKSEKPRKSNSRNFQEENGLTINITEFPMHRR